jgi:superoxide dismutase, Cu-Zn family
MPRIVMTTAAVAGLALSACMTATGPDNDIAATGPLATAAGEARGVANLFGAGANLTLRVEVIGMAPGTYGAHVHAVGRCEAPAFASAGPHWNPTMRQHGRLNPAGSHHGDLPNIVVGADGRGRIEAPLTGTLDGLFDADGAALVVHARADDERTDPSGNSGDRIACAVLMRR